MEISPQNMLVAFFASLGFSVFLIFFVFTSTVYSLFDVIILIMIGGAIFLGTLMIQYQIFWAGYPIYVTIFERRAEGMKVISIDRAKRVASPEAGKFKFHLKRKKVSTKPIDYKYIYPGGRGGNFLFLYMPQHNEFAAVTQEEAQRLRNEFSEKIETIGFESEASIDKIMKTTPENARYWYSEQLRRNAERWGKKFGFEKYANIIQFALMGFVMGFILYIFLGQMQGVVAQIGGITTAQAELLKEITKLLAQTGISTGIPAPPPV